MCAVGNSLGRSSAFYSAGGISGESNFNLPPRVDQPPFKIRLPPAAALCHKLQLQGQRDQPQEGQPRRQSRDILRRPDSSAIGERRVHDRHLRHQERRFGTVQWLRLVGNSVHFHFIADGAHLKLRGSAHSDFKAMTSGEYAGILFAQPPSRTRRCLRRPGRRQRPSRWRTLLPDSAGGCRWKRRSRPHHRCLGIIADKVRVHGNGKVRPEILPNISLKPPHLTQ
jgi:hypothetical protein